MLGADHVRITLDDRRYELRPSLGAAIRLERALGLSTLTKGLAEGSVSVMVAVIRETARPDAFLSDLLDRLARPSLAVNMRALREPLTALVLGLHGIDPEAEIPASEARKPGKPLSVAESLAQLYRVATGWLGWTPAVAWDATPAEIIEARNGLVELHNLKHGGKPQPEAETLESKFASFAASLRARKAA